MRPVTRLAEGLFMSLTHHIDELAAARDAGIIDVGTYERLEKFLAERVAASAPGPTNPRYDLIHLLWYAGALIVLSAMGMFSTVAFGKWGDQALLATAVSYAAIFWICGSVLWRRGLRTPGGLLIACSVGMTPLGVYALQSLLGLNPISSSSAYRDFYIWIKSSWIPMEIATIAAAATALIFYPFPFLTLLIAYCLWFLSMDLTPWLMQTETFTWDQRATVSLCFGLVLIFLAWLIDLRKWKNGDFAFWLHLGGLMAFWGGMTAQQGGGELSKAIYGAVNVGLVLLSIFLMRRCYAAFGFIGVTLYLGHLSAYVFRNSILFPFALSTIGLMLIALGLMLNRYGSALSKNMQEFLPAYLQKLRPAHVQGSD